MPNIHIHGPFGSYMQTKMTKSTSYHLFQRGFLGVFLGECFQIHHFGPIRMSLFSLFVCPGGLF